MNRTACFVAAVLAILFTSSCGTSQEIRYYRLAHEPVDIPRASERSNVVLSVETLMGDAAYEDPRIVYRTSPYRLDYYYYHRWTATPGVLVSDYLRAAYDRSGYFRAVVAGFSPEAPVSLSGRVVAFEEVDIERTEWIARVKLDLFLRATDTGDIVWSATVEEKEPVEELTPEGLAAAMSRAVGRIVADTAPEFVAVAANLGEQRRRARKRSRVLESIAPQEPEVTP